MNERCSLCGATPPTAIDRCNTFGCPYRAQEQSSDKQEKRPQLQGMGVEGIAANPPQKRTHLDVWKDVWSVYCECFRENFGDPVELSPVALEAFAVRIQEAVRQDFSTTLPTLDREAVRRAWKLIADKHAFAYNPQYLNEGYVDALIEFIEAASQYVGEKK